MPVDLRDAASSRFKFIATSPESRATQIAKLSKGELDALVVPRAGESDRYDIHVRDSVGWQEEFETAFVPGHFHVVGAQKGVPRDTLDALRSKSEFFLQVHSSTQRSQPRAIYAITIAFMIIVVMGVMGALNVILQGVVNEKFGRISEMVLSAIPARTWIDGKLIAATLHGIKTTLVYSMYGALAALVLGFVTTEVLAEGVVNVTTLLGTLGGCALGLLFWSCGFAAVAALMPNAQSPVKNTFVFIPMTMLLMVLGGANDPSNPFMVFLSYFPMTSPFAMPVRLIHGTASAAEVAVSLLVLAVSCYVLRNFAVRVFSSAVLNASSNLGAWAYVRQTLRATASKG